MAESVESKGVREGYKKARLLVDADGLFMVLWRVMLIVVKTGRHINVFPE